MGTTAEVLKKLRGLDGLTILALVEAFPGEREGVKAVLRGEKRIVLEDVIRLLLDHTGRVIPGHLDVMKAVCDENWDFYLNRTEFGIGFYADILARFKQFFPPGTVFVSAEEFTKLAEVAKEKLLGNELLTNLFNRAAWPLPVPQYDAQDIGRSMDEFFLPAAKAAYNNQFPDRKFNIYCGEMAGKILPLPDYNGHDFIAAMKNGPGVVWYFPNPMQGFSVNAQREAGKLLLPHDFLLNGAIEPALALVGFTAEMGRDFNTPGYDCPAVNWQSADYSLSFKARAGEFRVRSYGGLGCAYGYYSGGLVLPG